MQNHKHFEFQVLKINESVSNNPDTFRNIDMNILEIWHQELKEVNLTFLLEEKFDEDCKKLIGTKIHEIKFVTKLDLVEA